MQAIKSAIGKANCLLYMIMVTAARHNTDLVNNKFTKVDVVIGFNQLFVQFSTMSITACATR